MVPSANKAQPSFPNRVSVLKLVRTSPKFTKCKTFKVARAFKFCHCSPPQHSCNPHHTGGSLRGGCFAWPQHFCWTHCLRLLFQGVQQRRLNEMRRASICARSCVSLLRRAPTSKLALVSEMSRWATSNGLVKQSPLKQWQRVALRKTDVSAVAQEPRFACDIQDGETGQVR